jgi:hypothetical protein
MVYNADYSSLDSILQKIINYENEISTGWRKNALVPMSFITQTWDCVVLGERIKDDSLTPNATIRSAEG